MRILFCMLLLAVTLASNAAPTTNDLQLADRSERGEGRGGGGGGGG